MTAVKSALIRLAERDAFDLPILSRADQFAIDENLPDVVFLMDTDGKILHANRAINEMLGYQQSDVIQLPFSDLLARKARCRSGNISAAWNFSQNFRGSVNVRNRAGDEEPFEINCSFVEDVIYGVLRKDSSWEAIADMIDEFNPDETAVREDSEEAEENSMAGTPCRPCLETTAW